jgi:hypothetical protein
MYGDRKLIKNNIIKLRFDDYELAGIEQVVDELGGSRAAILHDALIEALGITERNKKALTHNKHA